MQAAIDDINAQGGINGQKVTHDPSERLSYYLADPITKPRPNHDRGQAAMKQICVQCHTPPLVDRVYAEAEKVMAAVADAGVSYDDVTELLESEGVEKFIISWNELLESVTNALNAAK